MHSTYYRWHVAGERGPVDVDTARADLVAFEMGQFRNADAAQAS